MTTHEKLEEILGMAFVGLYAKQAASNGMGFEFVDMYDTYDVLKADLKKDIEALIDQARKEGAIEVVENMKKSLMVARVNPGLKPLQLPEDARIQKMIADEFDRNLKQLKESK